MLTMRLSAVVLALMAVQDAQPGESRAESLLRKHHQQIQDAAASFGVSERVLASIVYAEQSMNMAPGEMVLDVVFAKSGYNSSIGLAQVKVNTALWIARQLKDRSSEFYLGRSYEGLLNEALTWAQVVKALDDSRKNLLYAAAYIAMIEKTWKEVLEAPWVQGAKPGVIATLYSIGLLTHEGQLREPHDDPKLNELGRAAQAFYDSIGLCPEFER